MIYEIVSAAAIIFVKKRAQQLSSSWDTVCLRSLVHFYEHTPYIIFFSSLSGSWDTGCLRSLVHFHKKSLASAIWARFLVHTVFDERYHLKKGKVFITSCKTCF